MFRLPREGAFYPAKVHVQVPCEDGWEAHEVTLHFVHLPSDRVQELVRQGDADFLAAVVVGWEGVAEHDGTLLSCTEENRIRLANINYFAKAAVRAYFDRFDPEKNS